MAGWVGFDLDGCLAVYDGWRADGSIGPPVPRMVAKVKRYLAEEYEVRIVTARVAPTLEVATVSRLGTVEAGIAEQRRLIEEWCLKHIGQVLPVTASKDYAMILLFDDRAKQVITNTGLVVGEDLATG